jgi:hypothetical protein
LKSTLIQKPIDEAAIVTVIGATVEDQNECIELQAQVAALPTIKDPLAINNFIEPIDEIVEDRNDDIFASVVEQYSTDKKGEGEEELEDDGEDEVPKVSINAAMQALETLKLWELLHDDGSTANLKLYDSIGSRMKYSKIQRKRQGTLGGFFKRS